MYPASPVQHHTYHTLKRTHLPSRSSPTARPPESPRITPEHFTQMTEPEIWASILTRPSTPHPTNPMNRTFSTIFKFYTAIHPTVCALRCVLLFATPQTTACQAPLSLEGVAISSSRGLTQGENPCLLRLLHWQAASSPLLCQVSLWLKSKPRHSVRSTLMTSNCSPCYLIHVPIATSAFLSVTWVTLWIYTEGVP